jgi:ribosome-associated toxin RatA of RatAB toxin-antitoxin module
MRSVIMRTVVDGMSPDDVYERISHFDDYPKHTATVRGVDITRSFDGGSQSRWEVNFRDGILRWEEEDRFFPDERRLEFEATDGDLDMFVGGWTVEAAGEGTQATFRADFDLGLSTLNEMVEPIAEEALRETIGHIIAGLTDGRARVVEGEAAASVASRS